jgi:hypothetical protein
MVKLDSRFAAKKSCKTIFGHFRNTTALVVVLSFCGLERERDARAT